VKQTLVILGSGAIGRGYLPWVFDPKKYDYVFIDTNKALVSGLAKAKKYGSHRVKNGAHERLQVDVAGAFTPEEFAKAPRPNAAGVFVCVGPRNVGAVAPLLDGISAPIMLCENDPKTVDELKLLTGRSDIYFAVPDVIASNTAPERLSAEDPLALVTEDGVLFLDEGARGLEGPFVSCSKKELDKQWTAKLYLHNTPHCVAAYLGALAGCRYVHDAMKVPEIAEVVRGSMTEMLTSLKLRWDIPHQFLDWYAEKELARFSQELLFDPVARVAREPLRKLELEGRLIGAAQICLSLGFVPQNILSGIASALLFQDEGDPDRHLQFMRRALPPSTIATYVLNLRQGEALERVLRDQLDPIIAKLEPLTRMRGAK
jgi:mannitol-1-phosphate 5-dehydrogenase